LKILHVDPERGLGGGETQVLGLVRYLAARGLRQTVAADPRGVLADAVAALGVRIEPLRIRNHLDLAAGRRLAGLLARDRYDIVHFHTARAHAMSAFLGRSPQARRVVTRRMDYPLRGGWYARWLYNRAVDAVVAISEGVRSVLVAGGVEATRIHVIPSGVETEGFAASDAVRAAERARRGLADDELVVAVIASLEERKGHAVLLDAVAVLPDLRLRVLCAGAGSRAAALAARRDALGLGGRVAFLGPVGNVAGLLAAADVVVMPSLQEGLGVAALEAMAAGRPLIASRAGGLPEVVGNEVAGLLVEPGDAPALAVALRRLAADPEAARALGRAGRTRVRERFSMEAMAGATLALYGWLAETSDEKIAQAPR
jgi:glycosyltransferase involved in cell wall biosynthesis